MSDNPWFRIGWRNLGRHRKRTVLTALGLAVGYFAAVFTIGYSEGLMAEMVENATGLVSGQIEIHDAEYRPERSLYDTIGGRDGVNITRLLDGVSTDPGVVAVAPRVYAGGLVSSGESTSAGMLMGIDPERELTVSRFLDELVEGRVPEQGRNELAIGVEMARQLAVGVGDDVIIVAPGADGSMGNDLYAVSGIFRTGMPELDASNAVLPLADLQTLITLDPSRIHEIAVTIQNPWIANDTAERLATILNPDDLALEVAPWTELNPIIVEFVALADAVYGIVFVIVFGVAIFGVANTMLMSTYERRREIAVMLAMGARPGSVVKTVLYEAGVMGLLALALGVVISLPLMLWWNIAPIDLSRLYGDLTIQGALLRPVLRVELDLAYWIWGGVALVATALIAALYPAARAARIPPADALSGL
jgi:ABC-type lipoprotein release transport system permease subunit